MEYKQLIKEWWPDARIITGPARWAVVSTDAQGVIVCMYDTRRLAREAVKQFRRLTAAPVQLKIVDLNIQCLPLNSTPSSEQGLST